MSTIESAPPITSSRGRRAVLVAVAATGPVAIGVSAHGFAAGGRLQLGSWAFWLVLGVGACWMAAGHRLLPTLMDRRLVLLVVGAGLLARALLMPLPFLTSTDAYRYLWDGRVQAAGINPYLHPPGDRALLPLRDDVVYSPINRKAAVTIYPPVAQMTFLAAEQMGVRSPTAWKAVLLVIEAGSLALLARLASRRRQLVLYAWNPVPIIAFALAGHVDALVVLGVLAAVVAWRAGRPGLVGVAIGLAAGVKLWPLLLLPAFARQRDGRLRPLPVVVAGGTAVGLLVASYIPYVLGAGQGVLGFLTSGFLQEEGYRSGRRFQLLQLLGVDDPTWALGLAVLIAGAVGVAVLGSRADAAARAAWLFGTAVILTTPYGWYATPLIALAVGGSAGAVWTWLPLGLEAAYLTFFHNVWAPWLGDDGLATPIRRATAGTVVVLLVLSRWWPMARRLVRGSGHGGNARTDARPVEVAQTAVIGSSRA